LFSFVSPPAVGRVILLLTAGFGDGHNTAARSVAAALNRLCPGETIEVSDLISEAHAAGFATVSKALYQLAITHWPCRLARDL
jgi:processive 1,2-diacylglycerol beta-glucosyltransferase